VVELAERIRANLVEVQGRIADAAQRAGRLPETVCLVAVTKSVGEAEIRALVEAGCTVLAESRPQQLWDKAQALADLPIEWHLVGHLQRNKVRRTLPLVGMIHSADSPRLIAELDRQARQLGRRVRVLIEVNISGEPAKHGFAPDQLPPFLPELSRLAHLEVCGLMGMASLAGGKDQARREFAALRQLRDRLQADCPESIRLDQLSMGMSGDFEVAVEEGATMVRIGTALFEGVAE